MVATSFIFSFVSLALPAHADFDLDGLNQQVQTIQSTVNNQGQEIKALQDNQNPPNNNAPANTGTAAPVAPDNLPGTAQPNVDQLFDPDLPTEAPAPVYPPGVIGYTPAGVGTTSTPPPGTKNTPAGPPPDGTPVPLPPTN